MSWPFFIGFTLVQLPPEFPFLLELLRQPSVLQHQFKPPLSVNLGVYSVQIVSLPDTLLNFPSFNSERLDQQIRLYSRYLSNYGTPDILIVGSSRALQGVDPIALQETLAARGYPGLTAYNFSINGATAQVIDLILRRILLPDHLPQLIIWADGSRAFNSGRTDATYEGIATSAGYLQLAQGERPIPPLSQLLPTIEPAVFCLDLPEYWFSEEILELQQLAEGNQPALLERLDSAELSCPSPPEVVEPLPPVEGAIAATPPLAPLFNGLEPSGFQPVLARFNPATYYQQFPRVSGQYDALYVPFELVGVQTEATLRVVRFTREQQIPLVFVNLPLSQDYLDATRLRHEGEFQQFMQRLSNQEGFLFRDLLQQLGTQDDNFADPSHLNQYGAKAVAIQLADDPLIPWWKLR
jgi:hypothetical protein